MPEPSRLLEIAVEAARAGGAVLSARRDAALEVATKRGALDLVTQVDREAERAVCDVLRTRRPDDGILAEESGRTEGTGITWLVDPLDGTTNFTHRLPHYAVSVAAYEGGTGLAGAIYDPVRDELFTAARGAGAFAVVAGRRRRLHVARPERVERMLVATGFAYRKHGETVNVREFAAVLGRVQGIRRAGAATLDLAYVAAGRLDGFWEYRLGPWDMAAGAVLVREAGGVVVRVDGDDPWDPFAPSVAAGHPETLARLLPIVRAARRAGGEPDGTPLP